MPQVIPVALTMAAAAAKATWWQQLLVYAAASYAVGEMNKPVQQAVPLAGRELMLNTRSSQEMLRIPYGENRVGGNDVFFESASGVLWMVQVLGEGECEGIKTDGSGVMVYLNDKRVQEYSSTNVEYTFHSGSATQTVDSALHAAVPAWTDPMRNVCYIVWKLTYNQEVFNSVPVRTVVLQGRKLYDLRDESTAYSDNAVLEMYDYYTNSRYGMGQDAEDLDENSWKAAATYCDVMKGFDCNLMIGRNEPANDILDRMKQYFRGHIVPYAGKIYLVYSDLNYESSCMTLNANHIARDSNGMAQLRISQPGMFEKPDGLRVMYTNPDKGYVVDELFIGEVTGVIEDLDLTGCLIRQNAADLGVYYLERRQLDRMITGLFRDDTVALEPHDIVTIENDKFGPGAATGNEIFGLADQVMRVMDSNRLPSGLVELSLAYEDETLYDDDYNLDTDEIYTCMLPDPFNGAAIGQVGGFSVSEESYRIKDRTYIRLEISWTAPTYYPWIKYVELWVSSNGTDYIHHVNTSDSANFEPAEAGEIWYFKLVPVNIWGTRKTLVTTTARQYTVQGIALTPSNPTGFHVLVAGDMIHLTWNKITDLDIVGYEIRWGSSWNQGIPLFIVDADSKTIVGIKPGSHTLWLGAKNQMGYYSEVPISVTFNVLMPPSYVEVNSTTADFSTGTHVGTERYDDGTYGQVLRVDRGASVAWTLSGSTGTAPIALCSYNNEIYASIFMDNSVYKYNGNEWAKSGDVGSLPWGMAVYDGNLYVACSGSDDVYVFNGSAWSKSGNVGSEPMKLAEYDGDLYVTCKDSNDVYVFNGAAWSKSGDVGTNPEGIAEYDGDLYVACQDSDDVYVFNGVAWSKSDDVGTDPKNLAEYDGNLYVTCYGSNDVYVFNGSTWSKSGDVDTHPYDLISFDGNLYVTCYENGNLYKFDGASWTLSIYIDALIGPIAESDGILYVSSLETNSIFRYAGNMSGYWESLEIDLSSPDADGAGTDVKARWWVLFTHIMVPSTSYNWLWLAQNTLTTTWTDVAEGYDTWLKLTQALKSGDMHMKLMWKLDGEYGGDWNEADYFEILSMEIEARYIKYRIYIDDADALSRVLIDEANGQACELKQNYWS